MAAYGLGGRFSTRSLMTSSIALERDTYIYLRVVKKQTDYEYNVIVDESNDKYIKK